MAIISNQTFPYTEVSLSIEFDPWETGDRVKQYLAINNVDAIIADKNGTEITDPDSYTDAKYIQWNVPKLDSDGNVVTDASGNTIVYKITTPYWTASKESTDLYVPVGAVIESVGWTEAQTNNLPIRWITQKSTNQRYFPITHIDAVIDAQGNKLSSVITWCREEVADYGDRLSDMEQKLLKEVKTYLQLATPVTETETTYGYRSSDLITFYLGDELIIPADGNYPDTTVTLVDEDGNVVTSGALPLDYTAKDDVNFYVYTSQRIGANPINSTEVTLVSRAGGGTDIALTDTTNTVVITDNDNTKTYTVAKASTVVSADGTTIIATALGDGTKEISVAPELQGMEYDETTHALKSKAATGSENTASGNYSLAIGKANTASGEDSIAMGDSNSASGIDAVAIGVGNNASGDYAEALGVYNKAENFAQTTVGYKAVQHGSDADAWKGDDDHTAFAVGVNDANAIEVTQDGTVYVKGVGGFDGTDISTAQSLQSVVSSGSVAVDNATITTGTSGLQIKDNGVGMDQVSTEIKQKLDGITLTPQTTNPSDATSALGGSTSYITNNPVNLNEGDTLTLNVGDSVTDALGTVIFTATATDDTYTAPEDESVYITTPDTSGTVTYEKTTYVAGIALADGSVTTPKIADDAVTEDKIADDAVTADKIADDAVTADAIADDAVDTDALVDSSVTEDKLADGAVTEDKLASSSVTEDKIDNGAVTTGKLAADSVITNKIKDGNVTLAKLADDVKTAYGVTVTKATTPTTGSTATYTLSQGGTAISPKIEIPESTNLSADGTTIQNVSDTISVKDGGITTAKIADANVTAAKLANEAKVGSLVVTEEAADVKLEVKDAAGTAIASDTIAKATSALAGVVLVDSALSATSENPVQNKVIDAAIKALDLTEVGGTGKIVKAVSETDGVVSATAVDAVTKNATATTGSAYTYTIGDSTTKVELPIATSTAYGEVKVDTALSATSTNPVENKAVNTAITTINTTIAAMDLTEVGGTGKMIKAVSEADGVVTATAVDAVTKETTATTGSAYTYTIGDSTTKVEMLVATTSAYGEVMIDESIATTGSVTSTNNPTSKAVADYVSNKLGDLAGAMTYQGVVDSTHALPTTYSQGETYVVAEDGTYSGYDLVVGNMLIANGDSDKSGTWTAVAPTPKVENKDVTLTAGTKATIAVIDGANVTLTPQAIDSALSATSENAVQNKVVDAAIKALDLTEVGGTGKIIKAVSEEDGVVSATAVDAVTKETTPTTGSAYTYTIGDSTTKVEMPTATSTAQGMAMVGSDLAATDVATTGTYQDFVGIYDGKLYIKKTYEDATDTTTYPDYTI